MSKTQKLISNLQDSHGRKKIRLFLRSRFIDTLSPRALWWTLRKYWRRSKPLVTQFDGDLRLRLRPGDVVGRRFFVWQIYEPEVTSWLKKTLKPGMIFFDVGANLGIFTLLAAKCVGPTGQVHVFEPSKSMVSELGANITINQLQNVEVNAVAVGDSAGVIHFPRYETGSEAYGSIVRRPWPGTKILGYDDVPVLTLDEYVSSQKIERVDVIKMDIEGAEFLALQGAKSLLSQEDAPSLIIELADFNMQDTLYNSKSILHYLADLDYSLFLVDENGHFPITAIDDLPLINSTLVAYKKG